MSIRFKIGTCITAISVVIANVIRFMHIDMTELRVFIEYYYIYIPLIIIVLFGLHLCKN